MSFVCARAPWGAAGQLGSVHSVYFQLLQLAVKCHASSAHSPFRFISGAKTGMSSKNGYFLVNVQSHTVSYKKPRVLFIVTETKQIKQPENGQLVKTFEKYKKKFVHICFQGKTTYISSKFVLSLTSWILLVNYACNRPLSIELTCADLAVVHLNSSLFAYFNKGSSVQQTPVTFRLLRAIIFLILPTMTHPLGSVYRKKPLAVREEVWTDINRSHGAKTSI